MALQTTDAVSMTGNAVKGYKMRLDEAVALGDTLMAAGKAGSGGGEAEVLTQLLPQVIACCLLAIAPAHPNPCLLSR